MKRTDISRLLVLGAWSSFFVYLIVSGEVYRYIGPRTRWVVWLGAAILGLAAVLQARTLRNSPRAGGGHVSRTELVSLAAIMAPLLIVFLIPKPSLGSEAASRKTTGLLSAVSQFAPDPSDGGPVGFQDIQYASESADYASALGIGDGYEIELTGFVTDPVGGAQPSFGLTRFASYCCAADVVPYTVKVVPGDEGTFREDTWLTVAGVLEEDGGEYVLQAQKVSVTKEPENPYI